MEDLKQIKACLKDMWSPAVAVLASDEAEQLCWETNGLSTAELLHPFGVLQQLNAGKGVPVRTPAEHPIRLHQWHLRFFSGTHMSQPPLSTIEQHLGNYLHKLADSTSPSSVPDISHLISTAGIEDHTPWYLAYRDEFFRTLQFQIHETQDQPVALLLVLHSNYQGIDTAHHNDDASPSFAALFEQKAPPSLKRGVRDGSVVVHYVFLHDEDGEESKNIKERALHTLQNLPSSLGPSGHLLTLHSKKAHSINNDDNIDDDIVDDNGPSPLLWQSTLQQRIWNIPPASHHHTTTTTAVGKALMPSDISTIISFLDELAVRKIVPHVESRIRYLDQITGTARKGLKNQLKSLLFRKSAGTSLNTSVGTPPPPPPPSHLSTGDSRGVSMIQSDGTHASTTKGTADLPQNPYPSTSIEHQMRLLSDLSLMVGDCETALSTLRLLASDFKSDKAYLHYAGTQEAMAVASVFADMSPSDVIANFKEAFYRYNQAAAVAGEEDATTSTRTSTSTTGHDGDDNDNSSRRALQATRCATRSAMLMASYLAAIGRYTDASWISVKAHFQEENLRAGLLLEYAAHLLLRVKPPRVRKFAFHLVLAGLRYGQGGERILAARSYRQVLSVYDNRQWNVVEEHVREALGKICRELGDHVGAVEHFAATLLCPHLPASLQSLYMRQFSDALSAATAQLGHAPDYHLPLPVVDTHRISVTCSGQSSYANIDARQVDASIWSSLEAALQSLPSESSNGATTTTTTTWLDAGINAAKTGDKKKTGHTRSLSNARSNEVYSCCVGEDIGIDVELTNPLKIELAITKLHLVGLFEGSGTARQHTYTTAPPGDTSSAPSAVSSSSAAAHLHAPNVPFQLREEKITLYPGERAVIHLRARPIRTGRLKIDGVSWLLNGTALGQRSFEARRSLGGATPIPGSLVKRAKPGIQVERETLEKNIAGLSLDESNKASQEEEEEEEDEHVDGGIDIKILPPMPRLEVSLDKLPSALFVGQVMKCTLRIKNVGTMTLHALRAATDSSCVYIGEGGMSAKNGRKGENIHVFGFDGVRLGVNQEQLVSMYIRPNQPGPFTLNLCFYYEPLVKLDALPYRTLRTTYTASVLPSLEINGLALASEQDTHTSKLIVLHGVNLQGSEAFVLKDFILMSSSLTMSHTPGNSPALSSVDSSAGAVLWDISMLDKTSAAKVVEEEEKEDLSSVAVPKRKRGTVPLNLKVFPEAAVTVHMHATRNNIVHSPSLSTTTTPSSIPLLTVLKPHELHLANVESTIIPGFSIHNTNNNAQNLSAIVGQPRQYNSKQYTTASSGSTGTGGTGTGGTGTGGTGSAVADAPTQNSIDGTRSNNGIGVLPDTALLRWHVLHNKEDATIPSDTETVKNDGDGDDDFVHGFSIVHIKREANSKSVFARLQGPHRIQHDFSTQGVALVDISLVISHELPGFVDIQWGVAYNENNRKDTSDAGNNDAPRIDNAAGNEYSRQKYVWCGQISSVLDRIEMGKQVHVPLKIAVKEEGWIGIGHCWVSWTCSAFPWLSGRMEVSPHYLYVGV